MRLSTRQVLDRSFSGLGIVSIVLVACALIIFLAPILSRGIGAFLFQGTVEFRRVLMDEFERGDRAALQKEIDRARQARQPIYDMISGFEKALGEDRALKRQYRKPLGELKERLTTLLGPAPGERPSILVREQYGQTRWDRAQVKLRDVLYKKEYDYSDPTRLGVLVLVPRSRDFEGTSLEPLFAHLENRLDEMLRPGGPFTGGFCSTLRWTRISSGASGRNCWERFI
jgi:phosphate transport system permease protein